MIESDILMIIGNYGFPIFVTIWFMFRTEKVIGKNTEALVAIHEVVERCQKK